MSVRDNYIRALNVCVILIILMFVLSALVIAHRARLHEPKFDCMSEQTTEKQEI